MGAVGRYVGYVRSQPLAHRAVPMPVMRRLIRVRADLAWKDPAVRFQAAAHMRFLVGRTERAGEVEQLARAYVTEYFTLNETMYRPWLTTTDAVEGVAVLRRAEAEGRGVVLHSLHHGQFGGALASVSRHGFRPHCPAHPGLLAGMTADQRAFVRMTEAHGAVLLPAIGSNRALVEVCRRGGIVGITGDVRGKVRTTFLGREVLAAKGPAQLAHITGALVVPMNVAPDGRGQRVVLGQPLDPREFPDTPALQREILRRHEPYVLAWPQAMKGPLLSWQPVPEDAEELQLDDPRMAEIRI